MEYEKLKGKKLLLMGGNAYVKGIELYAKRNGVILIAIGNVDDTPLKKVADASYNIDTQDIDAVVELVKKENIDGIFVGASEENILPAIAVSERTKARFYTRRKQWDILSDKKMFKKYAKKHGVPVPKEYCITSEMDREDLDKIEYPVIVKPVDGSGASGLNACYNEQEFLKYYREAFNCSKKKDVIVESLITDAEEVFFLYTIQDGNCSLSAAFTKSKVISEKNYVSLPIFHIYPSSHIKEYIEEVDSKVQNMLKDIGVENGVITFQGFDKKGKFCFFESGYRMGGEQMYVFTDYLNNINSLDMMLNYVLTGKMESYDIRERDTANFKYPCCNYYVPLKKGKIQKITGLEEIDLMDEVLNTTQMCEEGKEINENNSLSRVAVRIHVCGKDADELAKALVKISKTLQILDTDNNEMQIEHLEYARCLEAILQS